jgi:hypothetical protein
LWRRRRRRRRRRRVDGEQTPRLAIAGGSGRVLFRGRPLRVDLCLREWKNQRKGG